MKVNFATVMPLHSMKFWVICQKSHRDLLLKRYNLFPSSAVRLGTSTILLQVASCKTLELQHDFLPGYWSHSCSHFLDNKLPQISHLISTCHTCQMATSYISNSYLELLCVTQHSQKWVRKNVTHFNIPFPIKPFLQFYEVLKSTLLRCNW